MQTQTQTKSKNNISAHRLRAAPLVLTARVEVDEACLGGEHRGEMGRRSPKSLAILRS
jgi:hypothetical protein